jgi:2,4-dienoyl-CoA reductase-like NADH-dependent reductase (Old Yellow Enzyme family)/thioredoxin reductase
MRTSSIERRSLAAGVYIMKYEKLFEPIKLGGTLFRNRIFSAPTGLRNTYLDGTLMPTAQQYYGRKAMGGAAAVAVGECIIDSVYGKTTEYKTSLDNPRSLHALYLITEEVARYGAVCVAELSHGGAGANRYPGAGDIIYGPIDYVYMDGRQIIEMPEEIIERTIRKYADAALFAKRCGFGMVNVHAGHGWLLQQFLSPKLNTRKDRWGGPDIENRARLTVESLKAIRKAVGPKFPIEVRISGSECYEGGYDLDEGIAYAKQIADYCDLIHVSVGSHDKEELFPITHPSLFLDEGCNVRFAAEIKKHVKTPVAAIGALCDPEQMEELIASGKADVVEMARALIADPDLPMKARTGREDEIIRCMRCLTCFTDLVSYGQFTCAINPEIGQEAESRSFPPPAQLKKVLVVGGGIGGMEAAVVAARRGHEVALCEASSELGGVLKCERNVPFKFRLDKYIDLQMRTLEKLGVKVLLNTTVTPQFAGSYGADVIIAALGAVPVIPPIKGIDRKNVYSAVDIYSKPELAGRNVVVLGAGLVGVELAIYLSMLGAKVTVVEMLDTINDGGNFQHMKSIKVQIKKYGIDISLSTTAVEITENGVLCLKAGKETLLPADTVVYAVGQRALQEEACALYACAPEFFLLGDCVVPSNIKNATKTAYVTARNIGRS